MEFAGAGGQAGVEAKITRLVKHHIGTISPLLVSPLTVKLQFPLPMLPQRLRYAKLVPVAYTLT
jgi:hypothetical protein